MTQTGHASRNTPNGMNQVLGHTVMRNNWVYRSGLEWNPSQEGPQTKDKEYEVLDRIYP